MLLRNERTQGVVPTTDILLVAGQSNAVGYGLAASDLPTHLVASDSGIQIWNGSAFVMMVNGSNNANLCGGTSSSQNWGPEAEFAYQYRLANPTRTLYVVKYAVSSTQLAPGAAMTWDPGTSSNLFSNMTAYAAGAVAALAGTAPPPLVRWLIWMQGETDAQDATNASNYGTNLTGFISSVKSSWGNSGTKILIGRISNSTVWPDSAPVRAAEAAVSSPSRWVDTDSYPRQSDNAHYTGVGQASFGDDLWSVR